MKIAILFAIILLVFCLATQTFAQEYNPDAQKKATEGGSPTQEQQAQEKKSFSISSGTIILIVSIVFIVAIFLLIGLVKRKNKPSMEFNFDRKF